MATGGVTSYSIHGGAAGFHRLPLERGGVECLLLRWGQWDVWQLRECDHAERDHAFGSRRSRHCGIGFCP
jgi:hypothetical protein